MTHQEQIVRGVIINEGKLLLCKSMKYGYYYLPGGHIEVGETPEVAFKREMLEEVGKGTKEFTKIGEVEHSFTNDGKDRSEINHLYMATLEDYQDIKSLESHIGFDWVEIKKLSEVNLKPEKMKDVIVNSLKDEGLSFN